ncbi:MAG: CRTAC1 family protein [Phycisphaerales bacterium]|nr:CRTAC1 family protein [Phycisphaerales bacterium]
MHGCTESNDTPTPVVSAEPEKTPPAKQVSKPRKPVKVNGPYFAEEAIERGVNFTMDSGFRKEGDKERLFPEIIPGGAALFDADGDNDLDLYFLQFGPVDPDREGDRHNRFYLNDGNGHFTDASEGSGLDVASFSCGVATGDMDGDGDVDLYLANWGPNQLMRNNGDGTFTDVTESSGTGDSAWGTSTAFLDYDLDGDLDLFACNYIDWSLEDELWCKDWLGRPDYCSPKHYEAQTVDVLYRNDGNGRFTDVTESAGLSGVRGNGFGVVWGDFDEDGWPDIFVANDGNPNHFFHNQGDGTFKEDSLHRGIYLAADGDVRAGMGVVAGDIDEDDDLDILITNQLEQPSSLFRNDNGRFIEGMGGTGLHNATKRTTRFGVSFLDVDSDSDLDLLEVSGGVMKRKNRPRGRYDLYSEPNNLYLRGEDGFYHRVLQADCWGHGLAHTSRGAAFGDIDGDGVVDVVVPNRDAPAYVLRNVAEQGNWVLVRVLDRNGAPALGATVRGTVGDRRLRRDVHSAYSYLCANEPIAHFGLGSHDQLGSVEVRWPDGTTQQLGDLDPGQVYEIRPPQK